MKKERVHYFDVAKGIFILLLLLHHLKDTSNIAGVDLLYFKLTSQWQSVYTAFFMQAFFFVSGYCSSFKKKFNEFFIQNAKSLLLPIITFVLFNVLISSFVFHDNKQLMDCIMWEYWIIGSPLWFLSALFYSKILIYILLKYLKSEKLIVLVTLVLIPVGLQLNRVYPDYNLLGVYHTMASVFFVFLGLLMKKSNNVYQHLLKYCVFIYPLVIVFLKLFHYDIPSVTAGLWVKWYETPLFLFTSLTGVFASLALCKRINKNCVLEYFGRNSLIVYGVHYSMMGNISYLLYNYVFVPDSWMMGGVFVVSVILFTIFYCILVIEFLNVKYIRKSIGK